MTVTADGTPKFPENQNTAAPSGTQNAKDAVGLRLKREDREASVLAFAPLVSTRNDCVLCTIEVGRASPNKKGPALKRLHEAAFLAFWRGAIWLKFPRDEA